MAAQCGVHPGADGGLDDGAAHTGGAGAQGGDAGGEVSAHGVGVVGGGIGAGEHAIQRLQPGVGGGFGRSAHHRIQLGELGAACEGKAKEKGGAAHGGQSIGRGKGREAGCGR